MKLEVLEFYPKEKKVDGFISGDIKIRLPDLAMNLLGVYIARRSNGKWLILLPCRTGVDSEGHRVRYPIVHFEEVFHRELMAELYSQATGFIEKRIADTENPVIFPPPKPKQARHSKAATNDPSHQKRPPVAQALSTKSSQASTIQKPTNALTKPVVREFVDVPPKIKARTSAKTK